MNDNNMQRRLQAYYESSFPAKQQLQIRDLVSITAGWSHEMYAFDVEYGLPENRRREALVLRIYSGDGAYESSEKEFRGMRRLHDAGYPVPYAHIFERADSPVGKPFIIMERIEGKVLWQRVVDSPEEKRSSLHALFCELLFRLHRMDWRPFANDASAPVAVGPYAFVDEYLAKARASLRQHSLAGFFPIVEWLQERRDDVPCVQPAVMHGDFHYQNILLRDDGSPAVIDWTTLQVSDPRADLAWTLLLQRTHVSVELRDYILQEYERLAGAKVQHIEWFETLACLWRLRDAVVVLSAGAAKLGMRSEAVTMARQQIGPIKLVYELLLERTDIRVAEVDQLFASVTKCASRESLARNASSTPC